MQSINIGLWLIGIYGKQIMAISQLERAIDEHIAKQQQEDGLTITVDLTKPVINETERRAKNIERQLQQRIKTTNDSMALGKLI